MNPMPATLSWSDFIMRLALTLIAGLVLGYNRTEQGKAAGLRTTVLVCTAASVAMLQVNALLPMTGRSAQSFVMNDLMRLPLGILTGVGFIGGGAILRRGDLLVGVTTAATLWLATVIGLCLGGGQLVLGTAGTIVGLLALWVLKWLELRLPREYPARLEIHLAAPEPAEDAIRRELLANGLMITSSQVEFAEEGKTRRHAFIVREMRRGSRSEMPAFLVPLAGRAGVSRLSWRSL